MRLFWCKNDVITIFVLFTLNIKIHILCSFGVFDCFSLVKNNISQTYDYLIMKILEKLSQIFLWFPDKKWVSMLPKWHVYQYFMYKNSLQKEKTWDPKKLGQSQHFTYLWIFDGYNFNKSSQIVL